MRWFLFCAMFIALVNAHSVWAQQQQGFDPDKAAYSITQEALSCAAYARNMEQQVIVLRQSLQKLQADNAAKKCTAPAAATLAKPTGK